MLFTALLLIVGGFLLISGGISGGDNWKKPWAPIVSMTTGG